MTGAGWERAEQLAEVVRALGWFSLPPAPGEDWRARWVGGDGQVVAALREDGSLHIRLELLRGRRALLEHAPWLTLGPRATPAVAQVVLEAAMGSVRRCDTSA